ncbi:recombinase family protein [Histidinibacterium aquaticum]|uniref:Recombinase family protein n=1 Tax=Histidinibacterium aquaticum TaxID=2613962 RepID=A0A5J5GLA2_9RHOB|nr:recombinase family protein [Histidinibacterium aquaticum]KAA9008797.1 recombinase family protein [Histidinibacterium aquaticum]
MAGSSGEAKSAPCPAQAVLLTVPFNSLDAQHEACAAYIASQKHEGWSLVKARFDDGGVSGGTLNRPAQQRLVAEIEAGRIDMVVVYKIDRLTRSLADFAKLVESLEAASCSFVSVTQAFNTSSSMGRLTLNMLLSFAQFEREVTAERIRDKLAASKRKGLWMGGLPPLGYDPHPDPQVRQLVPNEAEAVTIRALFNLYAEHGCLNAVARAAADRGLLSKRRRSASGNSSGGGRGPLSRGQIHHILRNPVYVGRIRHKDTTWPAQHPAIVDDDLWKTVQDRLGERGQRRRGPNGKQVAADSALLKGKLRDGTGDRLTPTHVQRGDRRYRYYVSNRLISGGPDPNALRIPAIELERRVTEIVAGHIQAAGERHRLATPSDAVASQSLSERATAYAANLRTDPGQALARLIDGVTLATGQITIRLDGTALAAALDLKEEEIERESLTIALPLQYRRRGQETRIVVGELQSTPDATLLRALRMAHRWATSIRDGVSLAQIARQENVGPRYVAKLLPLAMLSPRIQVAVIAGTQPVEMTLERLLNSPLPFDWTDQERAVGLAA